MAFDGIVLAAVQQELSARLLNGRIDRIYQPSSDTVVLHIRQRSGNFKLLLSAHAYDARVHLTTANFSNPFNPPLFCMVLRKHLEGGKILSIEQEELERLLSFTVEALDELGQMKSKQLIVEIMGKHSNILLVDPESNTIIDGIKRYTHAVSRHREVLPGRVYIAPPAQHKLNPLHISEEQFKAALFNDNFSAKVSKILVKQLAGLSSLMANEIVYRAGLDQEITLELLGDYDLTRLWQELQSIAAAVKTGAFTPSVYSFRDNLLDYAAIKLQQFPFAQEMIFPGMSEALDSFFQAKQAKDELQRAKNELRRILTKELERNRKKQALQEETIAQAKLAEPYRIKGELLTANIYRVSKGDKTVLVENFYNPDDGPLLIELKPELSPAQNAQTYFKKYNKAKAGAKKAQEQLRLTNEEIYYLESVLESVDRANQMAELAEIRSEMIAQGYLEQDIPRKSKKPQQEQAKAMPMVFRASSGLPILVGKNNRQNDWLTMKLAKDHDIWLHVKDLPGSHVVIQTGGKNVPDSALLEAATLAAYFSKGQYSGQVPVDWTLKKYVRKPNGAKPGMVIYDHQQTIYVTPEEEVVNKLKA
ncbi:Rqc2 family fibronectin-binding protein [Zhaonella formicivorans]|uniref:Rqc2 family fibronectin-binding protein n=1 Tax=Zhaonella formicivorans TaxID=2528593 RepID=UPI0010D45CF4|nr:NFACT RNA binding domain-containing protein [Zhaonella formicivorans]